MKILESQTIFCRGGSVVVRISESLDGKIDIDVDEHGQERDLVRMGLNFDGGKRFVLLRTLAHLPDSPLKEGSK